MIVPLTDVTLPDALADLTARDPRRGCIVAEFGRYRARRPPDQIAAINAIARRVLTR